jgi:hypothetical protein
LAIQLGQVILLTLTGAIVANTPPRQPNAKGNATTDEEN